MSMQPRKRIFVNTFVALASAALMLAAFEAVLRLTHHRALVNGIARDYTIPKEDRDYDIAPSAATATFTFADASFPIWSNELGCFDRPYAGERPYIYLAGDSFTWGYAAFEDKWGTLIEESLSTRVLKCGVFGYGTTQTYLKAREVLGPLAPPRMIVFGYSYFNDWIDDKDFLTQPRRSIADLGREQEHSQKYCSTVVPDARVLKRLTCFLSRHSIIYRMTRDVLRSSDAIAENPGDEERRMWQERSLATVLDFRDFAEARGAGFFVVLIPPREEDADTAALRAAILDVLAAQGIAHVDLVSAFESVTPDRDSLYWTHDGHWNTRGNQVVADIVARAIEAEL